ncbi:MAG: tetratricopeptide repeat protein [Paracoccaceae bacterium]
MFRNVMISATLAFPTALWAAGSDSTSPPATTNTTTTCDNGQVWDEKTQTCVNPQDSRLNDDQRYDAVRELAYAGRLDAAAAVLATMADQGSDRVLTYRGFIARKSGDMDTAMREYLAALAVNPDNLLVRSYMGQGLIEMGQIAAAQDQLNEILARGGTGSWAEASLRTAIETGHVFRY